MALIQVIRHAQQNTKTDALWSSGTASRCTHTRRMYRHNMGHGGCARRHHTCALTQPKHSAGATLAPYAHCFSGYTVARPQNASRSGHMWRGFSGPEHERVPRRSFPQGWPRPLKHPKKVCFRTIYPTSLLATYSSSRPNQVHTHVGMVTGRMSTVEPRGAIPAGLGVLWTLKHSPESPIRRVPGCLLPAEPPGMASNMVRAHRSRASEQEWRQNPRHARRAIQKRKQKNSG